MLYPLVSTGWLEANLHDEKLIVLDASMQAVVGKEPLLYDKFVCLPKAQKCDLEQVFCDGSSRLPHAMPDASQFTRGVQKLGVNHDSIVVIYDNQGIYSSPRAWWLFRVMGFDNVFVLDGGLPQWLAEGRSSARQYTKPASAGNYAGNYQAHLVCDSTHVLQQMKYRDTAVIDARGVERFNGEAPEPRAGVRSGHIPGSVNLPFAQVLDGYQLKSVAELEQLFAEADKSKKQRIFSCGSGITACILILAAIAAGQPNCVLYDGSWADWGSDPELPVQTA
jgi:thiosulfate/3-mercaptopyruvate sulfurtransferase